MKDLSIIIVSYNTKDFLKKCLSSIEENKPEKFSYEILVVDNASSDGSQEMVSTQFPQVALIESKTNDGFAKANNKAVTHAKGRYILFLNPDTIVAPGVFDGMLAFMEQEKTAGAATCKLVMENGAIDYAIHRGFPTPWNAFCYFSGIGKVFKHSKLFSGYTLGWMDLNTVHQVDVIAGAFMLVKREAGESVRWWDEDYFFNGEDIDFCYKLKQKKWQIYYVPEFSMLHYNGVSGGTKKVTQHVTTASRESKIRITNARFDAMKIFYRKHYRKQYPAFITWIILFGIDVKRRVTLAKL